MKRRAVSLLQLSFLFIKNVLVTLDIGLHVH